MSLSAAVRAYKAKDAMRFWASMQQSPVVKKKKYVKVKYCPIVTTRI